MQRQAANVFSMGEVIRRKLKFFFLTSAYAIFALRLNAKMAA
jgi:hypothetical protein